MLTQAPRGTKDVLPNDSYRWQHVEAKMREAAAQAGFREVRTPVFEHTELFLRGVGDTTDIVQKEMYTFKDKGDRSITLKPEGTAGAVRALLESSLYADALPSKMYYLNAPIFRYEAPQSGRLREHHQFGLECFGAKDASADAELIMLAYRLLSGLGVKKLSVNINSIGCPNCRPRYHAELKSFLSERVQDMCGDCKTRFERNPLRVLDCKQPHCQELVKDAPSMLDLLCDECREHFAQLQAFLTAAKIPYAIDSRIVRGLDYYTKTVFELITATENGNLTVCGGGSGKRRVRPVVERRGEPVLFLLRGVREYHGDAGGASGTHLPPAGGLGCGAVAFARPHLGECGGLHGARPALHGSRLPNGLLPGFHPQGRGARRGA